MNFTHVIHLFNTPKEAPRKKPDEGSLRWNLGEFGDIFVFPLQNGQIEEETHIRDPSF